MSTTNGLNIPPGYSPPFAVVTENDHTAWILISTAMGLVCILFFSGIRAFVRKVICQGIGLDDYFITAATVFAIIEIAVVLEATSRGLGMSVELISNANLVTIQKSYYAAILLFFVALGLSKLSVIFLLLRLTPSRTHRRVFIATAVVTSIWVIASFLALAIDCNISHPWMILNQKCSGMLLRWQIICAFDIFIEVLITALSIFLVAKIHASFSTKAAVVAMFAPRLLMIIPISFRLATFHEVERNSNFTLTDCLFLVWTQTELTYSLVSATIPTMRPFISNLNTHFGGMTENESFQDYSLSRDSTKVSRRNGSFRIPKLRLSASGQELRPMESISKDPTNFTGSPQYYNCDVWASNDALRDAVIASLDDSILEHPRAASRRTVSSGGADEIRPMMIRKDITYEIQHQTGEC